VAIRLHPHGEERCKERGATVAEVVATVEQGETFPAKYGRTGFRRNFAFENTWKGKYYRVKQVEVFAVKEDPNWIVITVITKFF